MASAATPAAVHCYFANFAIDASPAKGKRLVVYGCRSHIPAMEGRG